MKIYILLFQKRYPKESEITNSKQSLRFNSTTGEIPSDLSRKVMLKLRNQRNASFRLRYVPSRSSIINI